MSQIKVGTTVISTRSNTRYRVLENNGEYVKVYIYHRLNSNGNRVKDMRITRLEWLLENPCPIYQEKKSYTSEMLSIFKVGYRFKMFKYYMTEAEVKHCRDESKLENCIEDVEIIDILGEDAVIHLKPKWGGVLGNGGEDCRNIRDLLYFKRMYERYKKYL